MNILYFHQHFSTPEGSTGNRSYEMACHLIARGHKVTMVCGSYGGGKTGLSLPFLSGKRCGLVAGINVIEFDLVYANKHRFIKRAMTFFKFAWKSTKLVFTEQYDVVFATSTPLTVGIPGIVARWFRFKPFIFEVRDLWPELPKAMGVVKNPILLFGMSLLERITYLSAHRLIGLSPGIVEGINKKNIPLARVAMISNGCDLNIFDAPTNQWRPEGVSPDDFMAIYTGTHGIANGLDALLDVAVELKLRGRSDIKLVLVGQGQLKEALQARAREENLNDVIFHEPVSKLRLAGIMATADIGLQILSNVPEFYYGTSPNKFFDYIACGLPVLTNYPGWVAEIIAENSCGYVVQPQNPKAFADALEVAFNDRNKLKLLGQHARKLAERQFDRELLANNFVDWIEGKSLIKNIE